MNATEQSPFDMVYQRHLVALRLQGKARKTSGAYGEHALDFGFLHANATRVLTVLQIVLRVCITPPPRIPARPFRCPCCGAVMTLCGFIPPPPRVT